MDIAALSIQMKQSQLMQQVSLVVAEQAMNLQQQSTEQLVEMIDAPHPTLGQSIDITV